MRNKLPLWFGISSLIVLFDQLTKTLITDSFTFGEVRPVVPSFNLVLTYNRGAAFSFLSDASGWQRYFFIATAVIAVTVILYLLRKYRNQTLFCTALSFILGGAIGNLWDRIVLGHVVDFIQVYYKDFYWPAFNVADSAITCGVLLLIWDSFKKPAQVQHRA